MVEEYDEWDMEVGKGKSIDQFWQGKNPRSAIIIWFSALSILIIIVTVIANFGMFTTDFKQEMTVHWPGAAANVQGLPQANTNVGPIAAANVQSPSLPNTNVRSAAVALEQSYNKIAHMLNSICVSVTGSRSVNGKEEKVHGSGIIIDGQYILTNHHVVEGCTNVYITVYTPRVAHYHAKVIRADHANDLAVMTTSGGRVFPIAHIGNSDGVDAGDIVFAMGNSFGSGNVMTSGMVCDRNQSFTIGDRTYRNMIRTETSIFPGASGGPLANVHGEIIGVNTAIYNPQGQNTGICLVTPINRFLLSNLFKGLTLQAGNTIAAAQNTPLANAGNNPYSLVA